MKFQSVAQPETPACVDHGTILQLDMNVVIMPGSTATLKADLGMCNVPGLYQMRLKENLSDPGIADEQPHRGLHPGYVRWHVGHHRLQPFKVPAQTEKAIRTVRRALFKGEVANR